MSDFRHKNIRAIRVAIDHHNADCPVPARAILLNPIDHGLLDISWLWGIEVRADGRVGVKRFRILCEGSAWSIEDELVALLDRPDAAPADKPLF